MSAASPGQLVESLNVMKACAKIPVPDHQFSCRLDWPARTLSFSHDGKMLASASEDHFIDIAEVETGRCSPAFYRTGRKLNTEPRLEPIKIRFNSVSKD